MRELEAAIAACQKAVRVPVSGRIEATGSLLRRLEQEMPPSHRGMRGVRGTAEVFRAPPGRAWEQAARDAETRAPLPAAERKALAKLMRQAGGELDLPLALVETAVTVAGNFRVLLSGDDVAWLDPSGQRFTKHSRLPQQAARALVRLARGNAAWTARAVPAALELVSLHAIQALIGPPKLDRATLDTLAIATAPKHPVAQACVAAAARLIADGDHKSGPGKLDFAALVDALQASETKIAERLIELAQQVEREPPAIEPGRPLTSGEIAVARTVFGSAIRYLEVKIHSEPHNPAQPDDSLIAPNGEIYAGSPAVYSSDYSTMSLDWQAQFIHEMTHVWQWQTKFSTFEMIISRLFDWRYDYLPFLPGQAFEDYGNEQQGDIVRDYYLQAQGSVIPGSPGISFYSSLIPFDPLPFHAIPGI